jgi:putative transposase
MPRTARASAANVCRHVLNRGNNRACVFHQDGDFEAFVNLLSEAKLRHPLRVLAYCVMLNHFHLALGPLGVILSGGHIDLESFFRSLEAAWL